MFNIFQYEKVNRDRELFNQQQAKLEKDRQRHSKITNNMSTQANLRRLEWAAKYMNSELTNGKIHIVLTEGAVKLVDSTVLECRKGTPMNELDVDPENLKKLIRRMDTRVLHPYYHREIPMKDYYEEPQDIVVEHNKSSGIKSFTDCKKPFYPSCRAYKKYESVWSDNLGAYMSNPYGESVKEFRTSDRLDDGRKVFKVGNKNDVWNGLIKESGSNRAYQSNKHLKSLPDMKVYKKSLEHIIVKKLN